MPYAHPDHNNGDIVSAPASPSAAGRRTLGKYSTFLPVLSCLAAEATIRCANSANPASGSSSQSGLLRTRMASASRFARRPPRRIRPFAPIFMFGCVGPRGAEMLVHSSRKIVGKNVKSYLNSNLERNPRDSPRPRFLEGGAIFKSGRANYTSDG